MSRETKESQRFGFRASMFVSKGVAPRHRSKPLSIAMARSRSRSRRARRPSAQVVPYPGVPCSFVWHEFMRQWRQCLRHAPTASDGRVHVQLAEPHGDVVGTAWVRPQLRAASASSRALSRLCRCSQLLSCVEKRSQRTHVGTLQPRTLFCH